MKNEQRSLGKVNAWQSFGSITWLLVSSFCPIPHRWHSLLPISFATELKPSEQLLPFCSLKIETNFLEESTAS